MRKAFISGNIGQDPEIITAGDYHCFKFSIGNNDETKKNDSGEYDRKTNWFNVEYWTKNREYWEARLIKGTPIFGECEITQNQWEQDGKKRSRIVFVLRGWPEMGQKSASTDDCPF